MYKEVLFRVTGVLKGKRILINLCYTEQEARDMAEKAASKGMTDVLVNILRFVRQTV